MCFPVQSFSLESFSCNAKINLKGLAGQGFLEKILPRQGVEIFSKNPTGLVLDQIRPLINFAFQENDSASYIASSSTSVAKDPVVGVPDWVSINHNSDEDADCCKFQ